MNRALLLAAAVLALAPSARGQDRPYTDVTFTRVHLTNGNFIDGQLIKNTATEVVLKLKFGEMMIRRDLIARDAAGKHRVELVKMRSITDTPKPVEDSRDKGKVKGRDTDPRPHVDPPPASTDLRQKIDAIMKQIRAVPPDAKFNVAKQFMQMGDEAAVFLASNMDALDDEMLTHACPIIGDMKGSSSKTVPILVKRLDSKRPLVRTQTIMILASLGDPEAIPALLPLLEEKSPLIRGPVIDALVRMNATRAFAAIGALCGDPDDSLRTRAIAGLFTLAQKNKMEDEIPAVLTRALDRATSDARPEILMAFGRTGKSQGVREVLRYLDDDDTKVRSAAAVAVGNMGGPEAGEAVLRRLPVEREKWPWMYLVTAATKLKLTGAMEPLIEGLSHTDNEMRLAALQGLRAISSQNLGLDRNAWQAWWNANKPK